MLPISAAAGAQRLPQIQRGARRPAAPSQRQFTMNFTATVRGLVMQGTYCGKNSGSGPVTDGSFTLTR